MASDGSDLYGSSAMVFISLSLSCSMYNSDTCASAVAIRRRDDKT